MKFKFSIGLVPTWKSSWLLKYIIQNCHGPYPDKDFRSVGINWANSCTVRSSERSVPFAEHYSSDQNVTSILRHTSGSTTGNWWKNHVVECGSIKFGFMDKGRMFYFFTNWAWFSIEALAKRKNSLASSQPEERSLPLSQMEEFIF